MRAAEALKSFHPLTARWFAESLGAPSPPQVLGWPAIASGRDVLIAAPTGSGKTLAAFLWALDGLLRAGLENRLPAGVCVIYVSPLRALGNDIHKNLEGPLGGLRQLAESAGLEFPPLRAAVRSGDTPEAQKRGMIRNPPHILITTPESLYILLTSPSGRNMLATARTIIADELHALLPDRRGTHLALSLERLDALAGQRVQRIGLSATMRPLEAAARFLCGARFAADPRSCTIIEAPAPRRLELSVETPGPDRGPIATQQVSAAVFDRIAELSAACRSTLVFTNSRRLTERVAHALEERLGGGKVAAHHGSLARARRLEAETRLKEGAMPLIVATASLELGIDVGTVDRVCHFGAPRSLATLLQRVGRAGHNLGGVSRGTLFPLTLEEVLQCAAAVRAVRAGGLDTLVPLKAPLDILAQQIAAECGAGPRAAEELYSLVRRADPYRELARADFDAVLDMLAEGVGTGRRGALLFHDRVNGRLAPRRGARLTALTSGGAIPDNADYDVIEQPAGAPVGKVNEDFAIESLSGDIFQLGNRSWRIARVERGRVLVEDAAGAPPSMPFWVGEAPGRSRELSAAVCTLRHEAVARGAAGSGATTLFETEAGLESRAALQIENHIAAGLNALGVVPGPELMAAERFFDEAGGTQLVLHAPYGSRVNRALGLLLRKRFCRSFDFELQAAATDDGVLLSLAERHAFPLEDLRGYLRPARARADLEQAVLQHPMFAQRFRWNAGRSLLLPRFTGGRKVPVPIQRMRAEDLMAVIFPAQLTCQDNRAPGPIAVPDHPLARQTLADCLDEALDVSGLLEVLNGLESGRIGFHAVDLPEPSPFSHEILNAQPYAFLDGAPLEERRARAVQLRRRLPGEASELGRMDGRVVAEVRQQARPRAESLEEVHDLLLTLGLLPVEEAGEWRARLEDLVRAGRAGVASWQDASGALRTGLFAAERRALVAAAHPELRVAVEPQPLSHSPAPSAEEARAHIARGWLGILGPVRAERLAALLGFPLAEMETALLWLQQEGSAMAGRFDPDGAAGQEWCERRLVERMHRLTLAGLRRGIEPVAPEVYLRFLLRHQHAVPGTRLAGRQGLLHVFSQLAGVELPLRVWRDHVLPLRFDAFDPDDLEMLCLSGRVLWGRPGTPGADAPPAFTRRTAVVFLPREDLPHFLGEKPGGPPPGLSGSPRLLYDLLAQRGACYADDLLSATSMLPAALEDALGRLVADGWVQADSVAAFARRLRPSTRRGRAEFLPGRFALWAPPQPPPSREARAEAVARRLLSRYGVVFRDLALRENLPLSWIDVLAALRRLEMRGEACGGRFLEAAGNEQYALPTAVAELRAERDRPLETPPLLIHSNDPLNLTGLFASAPRVAAASHIWLLVRHGTVEKSGSLGELRGFIAGAATRTPRRAPAATARAL